VKTIYYNERGKIDKFATYINNHDWVMPVVFTVLVILTGIVEGL
jgi:hypothetical protein